MRRAGVLILVACGLTLTACSSGSKHASEAGARCGDHQHRALAARLVHGPRPTGQQVLAYLATCGTYSYGCSSASTQSLDAKTGKPTGPMVTVAPPECTYTREFSGRTATAKLVELAGQCWLRARGMPELPVSCVPRGATKTR